MSNRFKCLMEDEEPSRNTRPSNRERPRERSRRPMFRSEPVLKKEEYVENKANFPVLSDVQQVQKETINYSELTKRVESKSAKAKAKAKEDSNELKPGWIQLKKNSIPKPASTPIQIQTNKSNYHLFFLDTMAHLYHQQKEEKIDILGEDTYNSIYRFQNYDYHYFDKLDAKYQEALNKEKQLYENKLYNDGSDISL